MSESKDDIFLKGSEK